MPSKNEKAVRKELLRTLRNRERAETIKGLPYPALMLRGLFDFLDSQLAENSCEHTLRFTREYVQQNGLDENQIIQWLEHQGGFCDCETLTNVEQIVADTVVGYDRITSGTGSVN